MNELSTALYTRLAGSSGLTSLLAAGSLSIHHMQAEEKETYPYLLFSTQGGGDVNDTPNRLKNLIVYVRGYSQVSAAQAGSIDAQADAALHLVPLTVSGWTNIWLARETDLELPETTPTGQKVYMSGGFYRVMLDKD